MFDELETEIENNFLLNAKFSTDTQEIKLHSTLTPYEELTEFEAKLPPLDIDALLAPKVRVASHMFKHFLLAEGKTDEVGLYTAINMYRQGHKGERLALAKKLFEEHLSGNYPVMSGSGPNAPAPKRPTESRGPSRVGSRRSRAGGAQPRLAALLRDKCPDHVQAVRGFAAVDEPAVVPPANLCAPLLAVLKQEFIAPLMPKFKASEFYRQYVQLEDYATRPVSLNDFDIFRILGRGAFGAVSAVQKKDTLSIFAIKAMDKKKVKRDESANMVMLEQRALRQMSSPFVLNLRFSFHDETTLYLVFDMCAGGDLHFHLRQQKTRQFDKGRAQFYAAQTLLGLEHIHSKNLVYRDLKPQNLMLTSAGNVMISDLGLTVELIEGKDILHLAGTPGYWAPEIISLTGTYKQSDWWSFGIMLYEMLWGRLPSCRCDLKDGSFEWCCFGDDEKEEERARSADGRMQFPLKLREDGREEAFGEDTIDVLARLIEPDCMKRLGANGSEEIKAHAYFSGVDWDALAALQVKPPYIPASDEVHARDLNQLESRNSRFTKVKLDQKDEDQYRDFYYVSNDYMQEDLVQADTRARAFEARGGKAALQKGGCCTVQ